jgi:hypothetical protein
MGVILVESVPRDMRTAINDVNAVAGIGKFACNDGTGEARACNEKIHGSSPVVLSRNVPR